MNRRTLFLCLRRPWTFALTSAQHSIRNRKLSYSPQAIDQLVKNHFKYKMGFSKGAHVTAAQMRRHNSDVWDSYFKFCFVRNPWDQAVSDYYWRKSRRGNPNVTFNEFLRRIDDPSRDDPERLRPPLRTNWEVYTIDNRIAVDFVGRFETLEHDLRRVGEKLGLELKLSSVPNAKSGIRNSGRSVENHFDDEAMRIVERVFEREIAQFGYKPPSD